MRYLWRTLLVLILLVLSVVFIFIAANWNDQALRPEVEAALNWQAPTKIDEDNGYLILLGFNAKEGADPVQLGKRKLQAEIERYKLNVQRAEPLLASEDLDPDELAFARPLDETCKYTETENCVSFYLSRSSAQEGEILQRQDRLLKNFTLLMASPRYVEITPPHMSASIPSFSVVTHALELDRMRAIRMFAEGKPEEGHRRLLQLAHFSQQWMANSETLISCMAALAMVQRDVRIFEELMRVFPEEFKELDQMQAWLDRFRFDGKALQQVLKFEGRYTLRFLSEIQNTNLKSEKSDWERRLVSLFSQPNASLNLAYDWNATISQFSPAVGEDIDQQFQKMEAKRKELLGFGLDPLYLKNPVAKIILMIGANAYQPYVERQYDTMAQIKLMSMKLSIVKQQIPLQAAAQFVKQESARFFNSYGDSLMGWDTHKQELVVNLRQPSNQLYRKTKEFRLSVPAPATRHTASEVETKPKT